MWRWKKIKSKPKRIFKIEVIATPHKSCISDSSYSFSTYTPAVSFPVEHYIPRHRGVCGSSLGCRRSSQSHVIPSENKGTMENILIEITVFQAQVLLNSTFFFFFFTPPPSPKIEEINDKKKHFLTIPGLPSLSHLRSFLFPVTTASVVWLPALQMWS